MDSFGLINRESMPVHLLKAFHLLIFTKKKIVGIYNYTQNIWSEYLICLYSNIRNTISFISQFLKYLDGQSKKVTELEMQDIADYVSVLDESDIKYSTFNRYITHMHTFLQFLKMKNIEVLKFYPERFLKKVFRNTMKEVFQKKQLLI